MRKESLACYCFPFTKNFYLSAIYCGETVETLGIEEDDEEEQSVLGGIMEAPRLDPLERT